MTTDMENSPDLVLTPGGLRSSSLVHKIETGTVLDGSGGTIRSLDSGGNVLRDFGAVEAKAEGAPLMPLNVSHPAAVEPAFGTGWVTYAYWSNSTGTPLSSFSTQWYVPPAPIAEDGQVIFLFNGIQNQTMIYQPVLQWGVSAAGGGNYWAVASWYADGQGGPAFHTNLVPVNPGDLLTGVMTQTGQSGSNFSYGCVFEGIAGTSLPIQNVAQLTWCAETLEVYGIKGAPDYPVTFRTPMKAIDIKTGAVTPAVNWTADDAVTDCGQHTIIVGNSGNNGEVDLCYGTVGPPSASVVSWAADRLDIFGLGTNNEMFHKYWDGSKWGPSQTGWEALGGIFNSAPAAVSWAPDRLDIFGLGTNNEMFHKYWDGISWGPSPTGWEALGGTFNSPPAVVSWGPDRLDIFGLGTNNEMFHKYWDGISWGPSQTGWEALGGTFNSPPAVVSWASGRLDLFGLGTDNQLYHKYWNGSSWGPSATGWEALGGTFNSTPVAVSWGAGRLDIFGLGTNNEMFHKYWDGTSWGPSVTGWEALGGTFNSMPAAVSWGPDRLDIFGLGTNNEMFHKSWDGISWGPSQTGWEALGGTFNSVPSVASWGRGRLDIFGLGTNNEMFHKYWDGTSWGPSPTGWEPLGGVFDAG
jgi:hypothetical protein